MSRLPFIEKLHQAYPYTSRYRDSLKTLLIISGFVFLFVFHFRTVQPSPDTSWLRQLGYAFCHGIATFFIASLNLVILRLFVSLQAEQSWKVKHEIGLYLVHFLTIAIASHFLTDWIMERPFTFGLFGVSVGSTLFIGGIPVAFLVIAKQNKLLKKHLQEAAQLNEQEPMPSSPPSEALIQFNGLEVPMTEILYAESDRNYVKVFFRQSSQQRIRCTIKEFGELVAPHPALIRCHRAYYVNRQYIQKVTGNAQGLTLFLDGTEALIPVSRSYTAVLKPLAS